MSSQKASFPFPDREKGESSTDGGGGGTRRSRPLELVVLASDVEASRRRFDFARKERAVAGEGRRALVFEWLLSKSGGAAERERETSDVVEVGSTEKRVKERGLS